MSEDQHFSSATLTGEIKDLAFRFTKDPVQIAWKVPQKARIVKIMVNQPRLNRSEEVFRYYVAGATKEEAGDVGDPKNTVLLTGYQAENTLGRKLKDGMKNVRIFGIPTEVRAHVDSLDELSGHADSGELMKWMRPLTPTLKRVFLVHGETAPRDAFAAALQSRGVGRAEKPMQGDRYEF